MPKIHVNLSTETHKKLRSIAGDYKYSLQELTEMALGMIVRDPGCLFDVTTRSRATESPLFTFIDLFAGIGGIRTAFEDNGGKCVFSSEWDKWCQKTYFANFGELPHSDINLIPPDTIPDHDVLTAGFPCQPFSIAGVSKKKSLGREHGFKDKTQGTLFFRIADIIEHKRPKVFLLENVKNLRSHDKGNTFQVIKGTLEELGYTLFHDVLDAANYLPQHRERIFIVGFSKKEFGDNPNFAFPEPPDKSPVLRDILQKKVDSKYVLSDKLWKYLQDYAEKHRKRGNGFGYGLAGAKDRARTLSARYYKDGSEILIRRSRWNPRRLTPRECARLMGFDDDFVIPVSDTQAYKQFGNSVAVPVVRAVAHKLVATYSRQFSGVVDINEDRKSGTGI